MHAIHQASRLVEQPGNACQMLMGVSGTNMHITRCQPGNSHASGLGDIIASADAL